MALVEVLSWRALNRATLARQLLLERAGDGLAATVERLVGLQAQAPLAPYVGLWSRLETDPRPLGDLLLDRRLVRMPLMRGTIHLATAEDCPRLWLTARPALARAFPNTPFGKNLTRLDLAPVLARAREILTERPRTRTELGAELARDWPDRDPIALAYAVTFLEPVVQVTPRGVWGQTAPPTWTTAEQWFGRRIDDELRPDELDAVFLRFVAAYGPASVRDMRVWSGMTGLTDVLARLRPRLVEFRDEAGTTLYDLPDAPRPDPRTPAPPRFLPEYDNVLLSHADRTRFIADPAHRVPLFPGNGAAMGTVLVDGLYRADWRLTNRKAGGDVFVTPFTHLTTLERRRLLAEGERLLTLLAPGERGRAVRIEA